MPEEVLLNAALRAAARAQALDAAAQPVPARPLTDLERRINAARLSEETRTQRDRREDLARWFADHGSSFRFLVDGVMVTGSECAAHLREGRQFRAYYQLQNSGVHQGRPRPEML